MEWGTNVDIVPILASYSVIVTVVLMIILSLYYNTQQGPMTNDQEINYFTETQVDMWTMNEQTQDVDPDGKWILFRTPNGRTYMGKKGRTVKRENRDAYETEL